MQSTCSSGENFNPCQDLKASKRLLEVEKVLDVQRDVQRENPRVKKKNLQC